MTYEQNKNRTTRKPFSSNQPILRSMKFVEKDADSMTNAGTTLMLSFIISEPIMYPMAMLTII